MPHVRITIGAIPDVALLQVFDTFLNGAERTEEWHTLVHVCQRWRYVVFTSPRRLNLRLLCIARRPVRQMLGIWPTLPIVISDLADATSLEEGADNISAALKHHDRVSRISLWSVPNFLFGRFAAAMLQPFPELTSLALRSSDGTTFVLPNSFLGGSAPRLRSIYLNNIAFPALRRLLVSLVNLVHLHVWDNPPSSYISPEAMIPCLVAMTRLESLHVGFRSPRSPSGGPGRRPPPTRTILPALSHFEFHGGCEYLEDIVARINAPLVRIVRLKLFNQIIFNISQLPQFIDHADRFKALNHANIVMSRHSVEVKLLSQPGTADRTILVMGVSCGVSDWQLSSLAQVCGSCSSYLSTVEHLDICEDQYSRPHWQDDIESAQWIELLHPFAAVKNLFFSVELALRVTPPLVEFTEERVTEVLPALRDLFVEGLQSTGHIQEALGKFTTSRQISGFPVAVHHWGKG